MDPAALRIIRRFKADVRALNKTIDEARTVWPEAEYYLACATLNLMSGAHHEGKGARARPDRVLASAVLKHGDGGDW